MKSIKFINDNIIKDKLSKFLTLKVSMTLEALRMK